ncbi:60s acidic ribosomal protein-domain-containing protein [Syncephalastrum racemosum]|uniref:60s acidic ribosomal protein-domain-containing protein n=1 Tax=Syncephalastrum racemosum TaxID=13706 RepID=A0A1X2HQ76_SYNRA|nr:60s acidic ribosomal protein-domain-containing protein [Syncephalastrum racemosum]
MSTAELAVVYAALILQDGEVEITADKLQALTKAAGVSVDAAWANIFAKALEGQDLKSILSNIGQPGAAPAGAAGAAGAAAGGAAAPAAEEKKEEEAEESDEDMGFGLFD